MCPPLSQAEHGVTSSAPGPSLRRGVPALTDEDADPERPVRPGCPTAQALTEALALLQELTR